MNLMGRSEQARNSFEEVESDPSEDFLDRLSISDWLPVVCVLEQLDEHVRNQFQFFVIGQRQELG